MRETRTICCSIAGSTSAAGRDDAARDAGPMADLGQQVADQFDTQRQPLLVVRDAGGMFDDPRRRRRGRAV